MDGKVEPWCITGNINSLSMATTKHLTSVNKGQKALFQITAPENGAMNICVQLIFFSVWDPIPWSCAICVWSESSELKQPNLDNPIRSWPLTYFHGDSKLRQVEDPD